MEQPDPNATQAMPVDPMKTAMVSPIPLSGATQAIAPVQCPICKEHNPPGEQYCVECGFLLSEVAVAAPPEKQEPLPCLVEAGSGRQHLLRPGTNSIGREGTDVMLADPRVSRRHAELTLGDDGVTLEDLGSTNGTMVGTTKLQPGQKAAVAHGQAVFFGGVELQLSLPGQAMRTAMMAAPAATPVSPDASAPVPPAIEPMEAMMPTEAPAPEETAVPEESALPVETAAPESADVVAKLRAADGTEYNILAGETTVGRRSTNDIALPDPYVSGQHAKFIARDEGLFYTDTGSTNGSAVNGNKAEANVEHAVAHGDEVTIGERTYTLLVPQSESPAEEPQ